MIMERRNIWLHMVLGRKSDISKNICRHILKKKKKTPVYLNNYRSELWTSRPPMANHRNRPGTLDQERVKQPEGQLAVCRLPILAGSLVIAMTTISKLNVHTHIHTHLYTNLHIHIHVHMYVYIYIWKNIKVNIDTWHLFLCASLKCFMHIGVVRVCMQQITINVCVNIDNTCVPKSCRLLCLRTHRH